MNGLSEIDINQVSTFGEGNLQFFEGEKDIPFDIKRVYYITDVSEGVKRGGHAHKNLKQMLFCPYGSVLIKLDNIFEKIEVRLDNPAKGLVITAPIWREMLWEIKDSVLCVAVSEYYDEDDYIRDYDKYRIYME